MFCSLKKEEAAAVNVLADQAFALISGAASTASALVQLTSLSGCHRGSSMLHASLNLAVLMALGHRKAHGEMREVNTMADLKKNPAAFLSLVEDINEIFGCICRGIDPGNDYMLNLFKMESKPGQPGKPEGKP
jgi:hypothetical protein